MRKKQEQHSRELFPIQQDVLAADFAALGRYDTDDVQLLKTIWMDDSLEGNPSHELLLLTARSELKDHDQLRRTYRAGVLIGTIIVRHQLLAIDNDLGGLLHAPAHESSPTMQPSQRLSRFALSQFFDSEQPVDIATHLVETLEADWLRNHNSFQPEKSASSPTNDWLAVGMGDTFALYGTLYAAHTGHEAPNYKTKPLRDELSASATHDPLAS